jgi:hypothetical protein
MLAKTIFQINNVELNINSTINLILIIFSWHHEWFSGGNKQ